MKIDLRQVSGEVYDLDDPECRDSLLNGVTARNRAHADREVLVDGFVSPSAIEFLP